MTSCHVLILAHLRFSWKRRLERKKGGRKVERERERERGKRERREGERGKTKPLPNSPCVSSSLSSILRGPCLTLGADFPLDSSKTFTGQYSPRGHRRPSGVRE